VDAKALSEGEVAERGDGLWLVVPMSRVNAWVCLVLMGVLAVVNSAFVVLGVAVLQIKPTPGTANAIAAHAAFILIAVMCFAMATYIYVIVGLGVRMAIKFGIRGAPGLWVDERGIQFRRGFTGRQGLVAWADVENVSIVQTRQQRMLMVEHADPEAWRRERSWLKRLVWWNAFRGTEAAGKFPAAMWPSGYLLGRLEEIEGALLECWKRALGESPEEHPTPH
jgi:hypothetical protein